ncbi:phospholipase D-like domain-containing protein [Trichocoleus sp. FACHB-591]|uniref:phospholipase D-like domain-containing protein n=1 Tax=Trichocoleus sp. FACHB-591 TaxID=2692872 RepID=UPI001F54B80A|nr:phospholipase D-like domain-containing protein [Trichocoleus sp. FACHB-591]
MLFPVSLRSRFYLSLLLILSLTACQQVQSQPQQSAPAPLPQDPLVQAYFNHEPAAKYTEPYRQQTRPGDNLEQQIIDAIASAQSTVDVAVQELRLPKIAQALIDRQKAGVKVRVILENTYSQPWSAITEAELEKLPERERSRYEEYQKLADQDQDGKLTPEEINQGDTLVMLRQAQVPWIDDTANGSAGSDLMHHKFVVVDGQRLIITSANFTTSDIHGDFSRPASQGNANNMLRIPSAELASLFTQEFNTMWGDGPGGKPDSKFGLQKPYRSPQTVVLGSTSVTVQFSPTSPSRPWSQSGSGLIGKTLGAAQRSVNLALFVFSEQRLANVLETNHERGVQVQAVIDPSFAYRSYSEALDMLGVELKDKCRTEPNNHPWQNPISTVGAPRLPPGDLLHNKFGVVDQATVIMGSHNWTDAANTGNDETLVVVESPMVAAHYEREFERLYTNAILGVPPAVQRKMTAQAKQCQSGQAQSKPTSKVKSQRSPAPSTPRISQPQTAPNSVVNLNTASLQDLETLPGVGPALAQRIIQARQQKPFTSLTDLDRVSGVGPKLLDRLEPYVTW